MCGTLEGYRIPMKDCDICLVYFWDLKKKGDTKLHVIVDDMVHMRNEFTYLYRLDTR